MNPSDYRRDFAAYCSALAREHYSRHAGLTTESRIEQIKDRYADLWTREAIDDLRRALDDTPQQFETERAALHALASAARLNYLETRAGEVTVELAGCDGSAQIHWNGANLAAEDAPHLIADESDATRRRELSSRWFDALRSCDDLRAARHDSLKESARELGCESLGALYEDLSGAGVKTLAGAAEAFLERTAHIYLSQLARWASRHVPPLASNSLTYADSLRFERASHLDAFFQPGVFRDSYKALLAGFGIRVEAQKNIEVDDAARALKNKRTACFVLKPPDEVRLVVGSAQAGAQPFRMFLHETGRAQSLGWASREQSARYPEFVYAADGATGEGHGFLFSNLLYDEAWVGEHRGVRATEAREIARTSALLEMHAVRRCCAALLYARSADDAPEMRAESLDETYLTLYTEATGFRYDAATRLLDTPEAFDAAQQLRARLFAASLREHLRARHGRRWYASRGAGEELIDVWNTASRYKVEEIAPLVGAPGLSFDLLAEELTTALGVE